MYQGYEGQNKISFNLVDDEEVTKSYRKPEASQLTIDLEGS
jgi:hypothetical protein